MLFASGDEVARHERLIAKGGARLEPDAVALEGRRVAHHRAGGERGQE